MKILHVSYADSGGGAARAAYRLHRAERAAGINSAMTVLRKATSDVHVHEAAEWFPGRNRLALRLQHRVLRSAPAEPRSDRSLNLFPSRLHVQLTASDADVVHLHWIHEEMISIAEIARIGKPIVWTLHDAWAVCGTEHYPADGDARYANGYERSPAAPLFDLERWTWARKRSRWHDAPFVLVSPSAWLAGVCRHSALFANRTVRVVPNPVPEEFQPRDRLAARRRFGLRDNATILLCGAQDISHPRKGLALLEEALAICKRDAGGDALELVVFGGGSLTATLPVPSRHVGWIADELPWLYSAADVFLAPSRIDNLPNTVAEATACGVPSVAFRVGGLPDLIRHRQTGFLAEPFGAGGFAAGIRWVLDQPRAELQRGLAAQAAALAPATVVNGYRVAYEQAIAAHQQPLARH